MKKMYAFLTALALFVLTAAGCHLYTQNRVAVNNPAFLTWSLEEKENSMAGLTENLTADTIPVFGSSEFQHGLETPFHPAHVFADTDFHPLLLGAGYYQSLFHAISLAAMEPSMVTKKAVLILSPQWFRRTGVVDQAFSSRFSEQIYTGMLTNARVSEETKAYISSRTHTLLGAVDEKTERHVKLHEKVLWKQEETATERAYEALWNSFLEEKDRFQISMHMIAAGIRKLNPDEGTEQKDVSGLSSFEEDAFTEVSPDWEALLKSAEQGGMQENQNEFFINEESYEKLLPYLPLKKDMNKDAKTGYQKSPEYDDLRCFLTVCQELEIEPMLVILPVNGYYYDYTGFPVSARQGYYENILGVAAEYGAETADFSDQEYTKYFFEDRVHLGKIGWVKINERIYEFYKGSEG